ncbi:heme oxygenase-like protein [Ophiobolus disseminans]|uniref:Heme oxygenase-like protein n=1 Tax=Ophiobolus disseminans TaxID=1469910 RepID=A0A6A6ZTF9_9PLEO|nr:heme oxygenase-like protein [Ophiobolus disseminans]
MPQHHPGTFIAHNNIDLTDVPWALTTHLLSVNHEQLLRTTRHPFVARAANGTLAKPLVAQWLANDLQYLKVYKGLSEQTLAIVRRTQPVSNVSDPEDVQTRLIAWLEAAIQNGNREEMFFAEVAEIYKIDIGITESIKNEGLRRYETLFRTFTTNDRHAFLPWLEGAVMLWAMEKVYYEAWSWARRQDAQDSPRTYDKDQDGGAMRREFIPNWSNRDFLMFVEQLERIVNEAVSTAVKGDDGLWGQVKTRTHAVWEAVLDAEEAFWPDGDGSARTGLNGTVIPGFPEGEDGGVVGSTYGPRAENEQLNAR